MNEGSIPRHSVAVVFDLDGTLIDSRADIAAAVNHALRALGRAPLDEAVIAGFVGDGARRLMARATGIPFEDPALHPALQIFLRYYTEHAVDRTVLMPGAADAIRALRDLPLAICTNKPRATTEVVLEALGLADAFALVVAGGDLPVQKPDPGPLLFIAERLDVRPQSLIVVGDGRQDIESAQAAGARSIAVATGFASRDVLAAAKPSALVETLVDAVRVVRRLSAEDHAQPTSA